MGFIRARTDLQREIRYSQIIEAAQKVYDNTAYDDISLAAIAREANFTRSNLYKYYASKEEIFVDLILIEYTKSRKNLEEAFEDKEYEIAEFCKIWSDVICKNRKMLDLRVLQFVVLEKKLNVEQLKELRLEIRHEYMKVVDVVSKCFPKLSEQQVVDFVYMQFSLSIGFYMVGNSNENQKYASELAGFTDWRKPMEEMLAVSIEAYLNSVICT